MDAIIQFYMEETEDLLQKAEECLIRLETEYSSDDVNELFRIAHTIKGSSHIAGYSDIGDVMHKIEDVLDCARNGSITFDRNIVSLCFRSLDIVKKMLEYKKGHGSEALMQELADAASGIGETAEAFIRTNKNKEKKAAAEQPAMGIISSLLSKKPEGRNKYYITFFIEEDAPMVSPVLVMILKSIEDIGALVYSSVTDSFFSGSLAEHEIRTFDFILCTDTEETELYTFFDLSYVEKINIVDLTRSKLEENDYCFNNSDNTSYIIILKVFMKLYHMLFIRPQKNRPDKEDLQILESLRCEAVNAFGRIKNKTRIGTFIKEFDVFFSCIKNMYAGQSGADKELCFDMQKQMEALIERAYNFVKGKHIFRVFKPEKNDFINILKSFMDMVNKSSTFIILIDLSNLDILHENEVMALIEVKKRMEAKDIETGIITGGPGARRIINIFDSIKPVEEFNLFKSEFEAILRMFRSQDSFHGTVQKVNDVQHEY